MTDEELQILKQILVELKEIHLELKEIDDSIIRMAD